MLHKVAVRANTIKQLQLSLTLLQGEDKAKAETHIRLLQERLKRDKARMSLKIKIGAAKRKTI